MTASLSKRVASLQYKQLALYYMCSDPCWKSQSFRGSRGVRSDTESCDTEREAAFWTLAKWQACTVSEAVTLPAAELRQTKRGSPPSYPALTYTFLMLQLRRETASHLYSPHTHSVTGTGAPQQTQGRGCAVAALGQAALLGSVLAFAVNSWRDTPRRIAYLLSRVTSSTSFYLFLMRW